MEAFAHEFNHPDLILLGFEVWGANQLQAEKFVNTTGITHPVLLDAIGYADSLGYTSYERNHFAIIDRNSELIYQTPADIHYSDAWQPDVLEPHIHSALEATTGLAKPK